eukprot:XP_001703344.1 predicted protein [Chlamydomonas reinhardtii]
MPPATVTLRHSRGRLDVVNREKATRLVETLLEAALVTATQHEPGWASKIAATFDRGAY